MICLIFPSVSQHLPANCKRVQNQVLLNMKTMKVVKVDKAVTTLKDRIGHPLQRHLRVIAT